jgi:hypothetical protein
MIGYRTLPGILTVFAVAGFAGGCSSDKDSNAPVTPMWNLGQKSEFTYSRENTGTGDRKCLVQLTVDLAANSVEAALGGRTRALTLSNEERSTLLQVFKSVQICPPCLDGSCHTPIETCPASEYVNVYADDVIYSIDCLAPLCNSERNRLLWATLRAFLSRNTLTDCP